jgi:hypothetical protein
VQALVGRFRIRIPPEQQQPGGQRQRRRGKQQDEQAVSPQARGIGTPPP